MKENVEFILAEKLDDVFSEALIGEDTKKLNLQHNSSFNLDSKKHKGDNIAQ